jgi:hypothetical protein
MTGDGAITYHAFIVHARADAGWAKWLHRRLESFNVRRALASLGFASGDYPPTLRPIFRGQEKSPRVRGPDHESVAALYGSAALIVLCSPASARSGYVSECVRLFKTRHPERLVIPAIVDGEPGGGARECYPQALRYRLDRDEQFIAAPPSLMAVDLRSGRNSREGAVIMIAARLVGVPHYDLQVSGHARNGGRWRGRLGRLRAVLGLAASVAAAVTILNSREAINSAFDWKQRDRREVQALVQLLGEPMTAPLDAARARESLTEAVSEIVEGARSESRYASALDFLKRGETARALAVLRTLAEEQAARGAPGAREAARRLHCLGVIAALDNAEIAWEAFARAARLEPDDPELQGDLALAYGALARRYAKAGEQAKAAMALREGKSAAGRAVRLAPADAAARNALAWFSRRLAEVRAAGRVEPTLDRKE